jgi:glycosyltransferase involved in cell wall biosynthesis
VIAVSHAVRDDVVDRTAVAAARVDVIYDGLDLSDFDRRRRASGAPPLQETNGTTVIALPTYVLSLKDAEILLAAIASLVHQHALDVTLWLIGHESLEEAGVIDQRLKEFCEAHLITGRVRLLGHRPDLASVIAAADIVCVPSLESDSSANVVLDAMAASRCVVAAASGSIPELIDDGREGILVPLGNVEALTGALARVVSDRGYRQRLGRAARARVERHFTSHRQAQLVQQLYRLVLRSDLKRRGRLPA